MGTFEQIQISIYGQGGEYVLPKPLVLQDSPSNDDLGCQKRVESPGLRTLWTDLLSGRSHRPLELGRLQSRRGDSGTATHFPKVEHLG